jgi:hypothetical protein
MAGVNTLSVVLCLACAPVSPPSLRVPARCSRSARDGEATNGGGEDEGRKEGTRSVACLLPSLSSYCEPRQHEDKAGGRAIWKASTLSAASACDSSL